jgi:hypothetical protein
MGVDEERSDALSPRKYEPPGFVINAPFSQDLYFSSLKITSQREIRK